MADTRTDKYDISCGQYLKKAYIRRTEKAPAGQRKAIGVSLFCVGKREKSRWKDLRKEQDRKRIELFNQSGKIFKSISGRWKCADGQ